MERRWSIIRTEIGRERRVGTALERKIRESANPDRFGPIVIPTQEVEVA